MFIGTHGPVSYSTIARWLKVCLQNAEVDVISWRFLAHSVRATATSIAFLFGLTVQDTESIQLVITRGVPKVLLQTKVLLAFDTTMLVDPSKVPYSKMFWWGKNWFFWQILINLSKFYLLFLYECKNFEMAFYWHGHHSLINLSRF